jgi:hypothetical protein
MSPLATVLAACVLVPVSLASTGAVGCLVTQESLQNDSTDHQFRYVITHRANEKDDYQTVEMDSEEFIKVFAKRGVKKGEKDGTGIIGAIFKPHSRLEQKNVEMVTALILDVDGKFKRDGVTVIEPVDPDWFIGLFPFRGVAHTSYNHSPAHPKYRVILPLDRPISMEEHRRLWAWAFERAQRKIDPSCKNADRMFYLARAPQEALESKWPWVREVHGPLLSIDTVPPDFVVADDVHVPAKPKKRVGMHFASPETRFAHTDGKLLLERFMEQPIVKWAIENPSLVSREVWRGLGTNLAAIAQEEENDEELFEACLDAFHKISEADGDRYRPGDTTRMFHDAAKSAKQYGPMTFARMSENGAPDDLCPLDTKTPISAARREVPRPSAGGAPPTGPQDAGTNAAPQHSSVAQNDEDVGDIFDLGPEEFLFDTEHAEFMRRNANGEWDAVPAMKAQSFDQMLKSLGLQTKQLDGFKAQIRFINGRKAFFDKPTSYYVVRDGIPFFNTYKPSKLVPSPGNWDDIRTLVLNLVGGDEKALEFVLDWLAAPLQSLQNKGRPMKMGTALVLRGEQGSGKGTLHEIIALLYGSSNVALLSQDSLDSRFNGELIDKLFVVANEVISSSNRSMEVANKLKMWVTDPVIPVEEKFQGVVQSPNQFNIVFTSNDDRPVIIERKDRRYMVFHSRKFDPSVASRIHVDLREDRKQVAAFFDHLLSRDVKIHFGDLFDSEARQEVIRSSLSSEGRFAVALKEEGWYAVAEPWRAAGNPNNPRMSTTDDDGVIASTMQEVYQDFCRRHGLRARSAQMLMKALQGQLKDESISLELRFKRFGGINNRVWYNLPMHPPGDVIEFPGLKKDEAPAGPAAATGTSDSPDFT